MKRENADRTEWLPKDNDRVCSKHFVDGFPTPANPLPTLELGYDLNLKQPRRKLKRIIQSPKKKRKLSNNDSNVEHDPIDFEDKLDCSVVENKNITDHSSYCKSYYSKKCEDCVSKGHLVNSLVKKLNTLSIRVNKLQQRDKLYNSTRSTNFTWRKIKSDQKMNFYTGISTIELFQAIFSLLKPFVPNIKYWQGPKRTQSHKFTRHTRNIKFKKLTQRDEFLLTLMRLRLNILNEDLADRFGISSALCSRTCTTWIKIISKILGKALIVWLPRESIRDNLPQSFKKAGYHNCRVIIDCTEVFIERPKSLNLQYATWSEYKHHNTVKFLVGITPSGFISFLSDCYGGKRTDKFITKDSGFYENLERDDQIMADRGFQIKEELLHYFCCLVVPPGARAKSQMTEDECKRTKEVANLRIHVERAINRIKYFRILKSVLPITMLQHIDDIVRSCAALCNLKPVLIR